jgi:hypothetical protein
MPAIASGAAAGAELGAELGAGAVVWARTVAEAANAREIAANAERKRHRFIRTHLHRGLSFWN